MTLDSRRGRPKAAPMLMRGGIGDSTVPAGPCPALRWSWSVSLCVTLCVTGHAVRNAGHHAVGNARDHAGGDAS